MAGGAGAMNTRFCSKDAQCLLGKQCLWREQWLLGLETPVAQAWLYPAVGSMLPWLRAVSGVSVGTRVGLESDPRGLTGLRELSRQGTPETRGDSLCGEIHLPPALTGRVALGRSLFLEATLLTRMTTHPLPGHSEET